MRKWFGRWLGFNTLSTLARITHIEQKVPPLGWLFGYRKIVAKTDSDTKWVLNYIYKDESYLFLKFDEEDEELDELQDYVIEETHLPDTPQTQIIDTSDKKGKGLVLPDEDEISKWLDENF